MEIAVRAVEHACAIILLLLRTYRYIYVIDDRVTLIFRKLSTGLFLGVFFLGGSRNQGTEGGEGARI